MGLVMYVKPGCPYCQQARDYYNSKGVEFTEPVSDRGYGLVTHFKVPGGFAVQLYQPRYAKGPTRQGGGASAG